MERLLCIGVDDSGIYFISHGNRDVTVCRIGHDVGEAEKIDELTIPETFYTMSFDPTLDSYVILGCSQNCYIVNRDTHQTETMLYCEYIDSLLEANNVDEETVDYCLYDNRFALPCVTMSKGYATVIDFEYKQAIILSNGSSELYDLTVLPRGTMLAIKTIGFYLALAILVIAAIAVLASLLKRRVKEHFKQSMSMMLIIVLLLLTSGYYSYQKKIDLSDNFINTLTIESKYLSFFLSKIYGDSFSKIRDEDVAEFCVNTDNEAFIQDINDELNTLCIPTDNVLANHASIYLYDQDSNGYLFACSYPEVRGTMGEEEYSVQEYGSDSDDDEKIIRFYEDSVVTLLVVGVPITDSNGETVGMLFTSSDIHQLYYLQKETFINMSVSLIALLIGVYMLFTLIKTCSDAIKRRRKRDISDTTGKCLDMAGIYTFLMRTVGALDSVIAVYIAKSLCADASIETQAFLVSLPLSAVSLGGLVGSTIMSILDKRFSRRTYALASTVIVIIGMLICVFAIYSGSIYIYIVGKFIIGFCTEGTLFLLGETLQYSTQDSDMRDTVVHNVRKSDLSASIISKLLGGYIAEYLSYQMVYTLGTVMCLLLFYVCILSFPGKRQEVNRVVDLPKNGANVLRCWTCFLTGPLLIFLLFCTLPHILIMGYKSYLFPLYSAGAGISVLLLSNISVFVKTVSFTLHDPIVRATKNVNRYIMAFAPCFIICIGLVCFYLSPNVYWAIAMLFIFDLANDASSPNMKVYLENYAEKVKLDSGNVVSNWMTIYNAISVFRSPLMSAVVSFGMNYACTFAGLVCGAFFGIFTLYNKRKKIF